MHGKSLFLVSVSCHQNLFRSWNPGCRNQSPAEEQRTSGDAAPRCSHQTPAPRAQPQRAWKRPPQKTFRQIVPLKKYNERRPEFDAPGNSRWPGSHVLTSHFSSTRMNILMALARGSEEDAQKEKEGKYQALPPPLLSRHGSLLKR